MLIVGRGGDTRQEWLRKLSNRRCTAFEMFEYVVTLNIFAYYQCGRQTRNIYLVTSYLQTVTDMFPPPPFAQPASTSIVRAKEIPLKAHFHFCRISLCTCERVGERASVQKGSRERRRRKCTTKSFAVDADDLRQCSKRE